MSKGGMQNMTKTLALEYATQGIRVNGVGPGATITPINRAWVEDPVKAAAVEEHIPLRRAGTADEMAGVTCFLASDEAAYITGQTIFVDGGLTLYPSFATPWSSEERAHGSPRVPLAPRRASSHRRREARRGAEPRPHGAPLRPRPVAARGHPGLPGASFPPDARPQSRPAAWRQQRRLDARGHQHDDADRHAPRRAVPPAHGRLRLRRVDAGRDHAGGRHAPRHRDRSPDRDPRLARRCRPAWPGRRDRMRARGGDRS